MLRRLKDTLRYARCLLVRFVADGKGTLDVSGRRILIVAPHPDDEVFGCAGLIQHAQEMGVPVDVAIITGGGQSHVDCCNISANELIKQRRALARKAAHTLGLAERNLHFLDYPDGGIHWNCPETEKFRQLVDKLSPDTIFVPHWGEGWPDHIETGRIVRQLIKDRGQIDIYEYCVWFWFYNVRHIDWPSARIVRMTAAQHRAKLDAIRTYTEPKAPCGNPWSGILPRPFVWANTWNKELYFKAQQ